MAKITKILVNNSKGELKLVELPATKITNDIVIVRKKDMPDNIKVQKEFNYLSYCYILKDIYMLGAGYKTKRDLLNDVSNLQDKVNKFLAVKSNQTYLYKLIWKVENYECK